MNDNGLGKWAVLDIETTGADPLEDQIIDIGFLQFDGLQLVRKYQSLVKTDKNLSYFIQKLTGINHQMLLRAPLWEEICPELQDLYGHKILAHNSDFEKSFTQKYFDRIDDGTSREEFVDSLLFLGTLFPQRSTLNLEGFIQDFKIASKETHRGFQDALDLLKVMLASIFHLQHHKKWFHACKNSFDRNQLNDHWFYHFLNLTTEDLEILTKQIDWEFVSSDLFNKDQGLQKATLLQNGRYMDDPMEFNGGSIKGFFQNEEYVRSFFSGYQYRKSQEDLALKVGQCFKNSVHAMVQAPTGTGKTMAYLIPALLYAHDEKKQILLATGTKTLQEQAMAKDIPMALKMLNLKNQLKVVKLVGSKNHFCEFAYQRFLQEEDLFDGGEDLKWAKVIMDLFFEYNKNCTDDSMLIREDLSYVLRKKNQALEKLYRDLAVDFRGCLGRRCQVKETCSYWQGLSQAKDAHVIVGNHSLMYSWPQSSPRPAAIVVDEAHRLEKETTQAFEYVVDESRMIQVLTQLNLSQGIGSLYYLLANDEDFAQNATEQIDMIRKETISASQRLKDQMDGLNLKVEFWFKKRPRFTELFWNEAPMMTSKEINPIALEIRKRFEGIHFIIKDYMQFLSKYWIKYDLNLLTNDHLIMAYTNFQSFYVHLEEMVNHLDIILGDGEEYTKSIKFHEQEGIALCASPIDVGRLIHDHLLETTDAVVMVSATLGNADGSIGSKGMEWALGQTYLNPERRFKSAFFLPSVYDYQNKANIFLCDDVPKLYQEDFVPHVLDAIKPLIDKLFGRSLLLFSSKARFEKARELLIKDYEGKIPLFIQGMGHNLVEEFKNAGEGILLGMESFSEGIDIPGDSLKFVLVDKIPDTRMDLVIEERRKFFEKSFGNEFVDYYLSYRSRCLHQKLGRLLRTENDVGGAIVVDSRIQSWKKRTMDQFVQLMRPYELKTSGLKEAVKSLENFL